MTHGPSSSEDGTVEGKLSRIAFPGTIDRTHTRSFTGAANRPALFCNSATNRRVKPSHRSSQLFAALTFAAVLVLAPHPAFAQHGGGGGGGHAGGGGFGGGHGGGFGGGHASGSGSRGGGASAPHGSYGGSSSGGASNGGATNSAAHSAPPSRFIGGSAWQAPPSTAMRGGAQPSSHFITADEAAASNARVVRPPVEPRGIGNPLGASTALRGSSFATSNAMRTRPFAAQFVGAPPHVPPFRHRPIFFGPGFGPGFGFGGCFGPFFFGCGGGFFGGGFGFGFGLGYGYGYCDPFWGCPAGFYGSYYNGGYYGNQIYNQSTDESSVSNEFNPSRYWGPSAPPEETGGGGSASSSDSEVVLFLKDGTVYAITDYWIADNKLHYVTNYGGENSIPLDQLDIQRTVDVNAKRGINITLRPTPTPQSQQQAAPEPDAAPPAPEPASPPQPTAPPPPPAPPQ
jgi:hypothetical protein